MNALKTSILTLSLIIAGTMWTTASAQISFNKTFGGSDNDYLDEYIYWGGFGRPKSIKLATDGTVWMCGSTKSNDGDLATASNNDGDVPAIHGGRDAWIFSINYGTTGI